MKLDNDSLGLLAIFIFGLGFLGGFTFVRFFIC